MFVCNNRQCIHAKSGSVAAKGALADSSAINNQPMLMMTEPIIHNGLPVQQIRNEVQLSPLALAG
jgi:hypothetical protein